MEGNQYRDTRIRELQAGKNILLLLKVFILIVIIIFLLYSTAGNAILVTFLLMTLKNKKRL